MLLSPWLSLAVAALPCLAKPEFKGVSPEKASLYIPIGDTSPPRWQCLNSSQQISFSAINDDYCDCADGSDEPGTGACANTTFHCANIGHIGADIPSSRVNDGLCERECCDGSDEPKGLCPNICGPMGESHRKAFEAERKIRRTGAKLRSSYIAFAKKEKKRLEVSVHLLKEEVAVKQKEETRLKEILDQTETLDAAAIHLKKQSPLYHLLNNHTDLLENLLEREAELKERISALETVLAGLAAGYNPNYQDMAVLEAVRGWEALKDEPDGSAEDQIDQGDQGSEKAEATPPAVEWTEERIDELKGKDPLSALLEHELHIGATGSEDFTSLLFSLENYIPDILLPTFAYGRDYFLTVLRTLGIVGFSATSSSDSEAAKRAHQSALDALRQSQSRLADEESALNKLGDPVHGYGKDGEWRKLEGQCLEKDTGEYTYSVCLFGDATQRSNHGGGTNSLGRFSSWSRLPTALPGKLEYYSQQIYDKGARCWNGPERSVKLDLSCGLENTILTIAEPEKCEYWFTGTTPALCWPEESDKVGEGKEEL